MKARLVLVLLVPPPSEARSSSSSSFSVAGRKTRRPVVLCRASSNLASPSEIGGTIRTPEDGGKGGVFDWCGLDFRQKREKKGRRERDKERENVFLQNERGKDV